MPQLKVKVRLVMGCHVNFNDFYSGSRFLYVNAEDVARVLRPGDWLSVVDFSNFYLGIPIHAVHQQYLRFYCPRALSWKRLTRMPFGAHLAPYYCSVVSAAPRSNLGRPAQPAKQRRPTGGAPSCAFPGAAKT